MVTICGLALLLLLLLPLVAGYALPPPPPPPHRSIIKVHASGFLPFESDLLLPLGILRRLQAQAQAQAQEHGTRSLNAAAGITHQQLHYGRPKLKPKQQQLRLERARLRGHDAAKGISMYNLIDDDGELLLNLRLHNDGYAGSAQLPSEDTTPWLPSMWRPTTVLSATSSSPRPLPLHEYMSNSIEQQPYGWQTYSSPQAWPTWEQQN